MSGEIGMAGGEATRLSADAGVYDSVAERVRLSATSGSATPDSRCGCEAPRSTSSGRYQSDKLVEVHVVDGTTILGDRAAARNNGQELTFEGHVRTTIVPQPEAAADADAKGNNP